MVLAAYTPSVSHIRTLIRDREEDMTGKLENIHIAPLTQARRSDIKQAFTISWLAVTRRIF